MKNLPDQSEVLTENAQLELQAKNLRAQLAARGKTVAEPKLAADRVTDILADNKVLKAHVAELEAMLAKPAPDKLTRAPGETMTAYVLRMKAARA